MCGNIPGDELGNERGSTRGPTNGKAMVEGKKNRGIWQERGGGEGRPAKKDNKKNLLTTKKRC